MRIVVDLTPLLPGGENGGAKPMALELIKSMASCSPQWEFVLLTLARTFDELGALQQPNVQIVRPDEVRSSRYATGLAGFIGKLSSRNHNRNATSHSLGKLAPKSTAASPSGRDIGQPPASQHQNRKSLWSRFRSLGSTSVVSRLGGDVLFCPFTAPFFAQSLVPTVSVIHDLQFADYPQFFEEHERAERERHFTQACQQANRLVCVSEFVRRRVLEKSGLPEQQVTTVSTRLARRLARAEPEISRSVIAHLQLAPERYFLYPANFWRHKNHEMLLIAMGLLNRRAPNSDIKLVCTGAPGERRDFLRSAADRMGLAQRVIFPGYLDEAEFSALMHGCLAVVFPSLYEGFGMPVVEAQAIGKPVLCSGVTSLPEVAGKAALIFDPKLPESIVDAMQQIQSKESLRTELVRLGFENAKRFADRDAMASEYLKIIEEVQKSSTPTGRLQHG